MTPDVPLSENVTVWSVNECGDESKYMTRDGNGSWVHIDDYRALASERDELKYKMQVMADMVGEENWSLRNQLADAQARANEWKQCYQSVVGETYEDDSIDTLKQQHATLRERCERLEKANSLLMECSYQSHSGHWDRTGQSGAGCDECNRARRLREEAKALATGAETGEKP